MKRSMDVPAGKDLLIWASLVTVLMIALVAGGCATEVGQHTFLGAPHVAKPANYPIEVYTNGLPTRPFDRVAVLDVHCESQGFLSPNLEHDGLPVLIKQARAAGCDAVIEIQEAKLPANWTLETRSKHFTGVGVSYK